MDDLEFRRALLADPNTKTDEINAAIAQDPSRKLYVEEIRSFNAKIERAVKVDVPEDLASKLILRQTMVSNETPETQAKVPRAKAANDGKYWQIAAAACVAFVMGLMLNVNILQPETNTMRAGEYALNYTYRNIDDATQGNDQISLNLLNAKLASYGVQMEQEIGDVYYADTYFCNFNNMNVMRLVVAGETGKISLYIFPKNNKLDNWDEFSDDRFNGKATRYSNADMVIVGEKEEPLRAFQSKVENSIKWI